MIEVQRQDYRAVWLLGDWYVAKSTLKTSGQHCQAVH